MARVTLPVTGLTLDFRRRTLLTDEERQRQALGLAKPKLPPPMGISPFMFKATLKWMLSSVIGGEETFIEVLRQIPGDMQQIVAIWDASTVTQRKKKTLDGICLEAGVQPSEAFGVFAEHAFKLSLNVCKVMAAVSAPHIMQASIEKAMNVDDGTEERKMHFQASGFVPSSKGIAIQANFNPPPVPNQPQQPTTRTLTFEEEQRQVADTLRGRPALSAPAESVDAELVKREPACIPDGL